MCDAAVMVTVTTVRQRQVRLVARDGTSMTIALPIEAVGVVINGHCYWLTQEDTAHER